MALIDRSKSRKTFSRPKPQVEPPKSSPLASPNPNSTSAFFHLPSKIRKEIYKHAFSRSTIECFSALHHEQRANPATGLLLACRQTKDEVEHLHRLDAIFNLWPQIHFEKMSVPQSWLRSKVGVTIAKRPSNVHRLAMLLSLRSEPGTMCDQYVYSNVLSNSGLDVKEMYVRICVCGALKWLCESPKNIRAFCETLEGFAEHFGGLEKVNVLYCGQQWPTWIQAVGHVPFGQIVLAGHERRMASGGEWSVKEIGTKEVAQDPFEDQSFASDHATNAMKTKGDDDICRLRTTLTSKEASEKDRLVKVDYFDSWTVLDEKCVRDKPRQMTTKPKAKSTPVKKNKLARKPTNSEKVVAKLKNFVEKAPLGPNWALHKYMPATKDAGAEDRGSHWRRY